MKLNTTRTVLTGHPHHDLVVTTNDKTAGIWIINTQTDHKEARTHLGKAGHARAQTDRNHGAKDLTDHELSQILTNSHTNSQRSQRHQMGATNRPRERCIVPVSNKLELLIEAIETHTIH